MTALRSTGRTFEARVRRTGGRLHLQPLLGDALPGLVAGEQLALQRPVPGDATYEELVTVVAADGEDVLLEPVGERRRRQQREHVRTPVRGTLIRLRPVADTHDRPESQGAVESETEHEARVLDVSAGGVRLAHPGVPCQPGSRWRVQAVLPGGHQGPELVFDLVAEVRRCRVNVVVGQGEGTICGMRFVDVPPRVDQRITQWVFRQQARTSHVGRSA